MCPLCNGSASIKWIAKRESELLPVGYFLLTFTIPKELKPLFFANKKTCYNLLFKAVSCTLQDSILNNKRRMNGNAGFFGVLHTWDQRVNYHPHLHVVIPSGCLSSDRTEWNPSHLSFFLPVKKLSADFRGKLLYYLRKEQKAGRLIIPKRIKDLKFLLNSLQLVPWVVNSQAPGKNRKPEHMLRYLSRYVTKTAVNDKRIKKIENGKVYLRFYDRKRKIPKTETLTEELFMKRLVMHILPKGFKKTRFFGFMANRHRTSMLVLCKMLLGQSLQEQEEQDKTFLEDTAFLFWKYFHIDITKCRECFEGHIFITKGPLKGG
jgi:hypothetical protein